MSTQQASSLAHLLGKLLNEEAASEAGPAGLPFLE